ncbi:MAG: hypothetical protein J4473_03030 [Candidatus Aenigmarchaeota archaeon]|nr:hypothetical protein [Candidatus Aenigmarchaeota archaeon]
MEKTLYYNTTYKGISKSEIYLIRASKENGIMVFGVEELRRISGWNRVKIHNTLNSMREKNIITRIKRNKYVITEDVQKNIYKISTSVFSPSYISFWTALSFYNFTEQHVKAIQVVSTRQYKNIKINGFLLEPSKFRPEKFYGYHVIEGVIIAEKEKALIDSFFMMEKCGGFDEIVKCLKNSWKEIEQEKFFDYLTQFGSKSCVSRVGYIIENSGLKTEYSFRNLEQYKSETFVKLNPANKKSGNYNKKWSIIY